MADITFRTDGPWGAGKGSNLTPVEVDENFHALNEEITDLTENGPEPVGIADFIVNGQQFTVVLTDATVLGPFLLPIAVWRWAGEWQSGVTYEPLDVFAAPSPDTGARGLYFVLQQHESPTDFDPDQSNTDGPVLQFMLEVPDGKRVSIVPRNTALLTLDATMFGTVQRSVFDALDVEIVVPDETLLIDEGNFPDYDGGVITIRQAGEGTCFLNPEAGVTVNPPPGLSLTFRGPGATVTLIRIEQNVWDAAGDLSAEEIPTEVPT